MIWDAAAIAELTQLWNSPEAPSASVIAAHMGTPTDRLSRSAIIGKVHRLGLAKRSSATVAPRPKPRHRPARPPTITAAPPPEPMPDTPDELIPIGQRRTLEQLTNVTCRWPVNDPGTPDFFFCGHESADLNIGIPYCRIHGARAFAGHGRAPERFPWGARAG